MNPSELLKRMEPVTAPPGFEARVLQALGERRRAFPALRRARVYRWSVSAAATLLLAGFITLNFPSFRSAAGTAVAARSEIMHLNEPVDYRGDLRSASYEPGTIYILEQVSEASNRIARY